MVLNPAQEAIKRRILTLFRHFEDVPEYKGKGGTVASVDCSAQMDNEIYPRLVAAAVLNGAVAILGRVSTPEIHRLILEISASQPPDSAFIDQAADI